jgi:Subtilase family
LHPESRSRQERGQHMTYGTSSGGRQGGAADYLMPSPAYEGGLPLGIVGNVGVGVIDTGIVLQDGLPHPYIRKNLADGWQSEEDEIPSDGVTLGRYDCHGTCISGLIVMQAPTVALHVKNVLDKNEAKGIGSDVAVVQAIHELGLVSNVKIINMSFLSPSAPELVEPSKIKDALTQLFRIRPDILVVTAAGNLNTDAKSYPGAFSQELEFGRRVIAVGAVDESIIPIRASLPPKASFSNYGTWVNCYAPGVRVLGPTLTYTETTGPGGRPARTFTGWGRWSGTSFAAAQVSGQLAQAMIEEESLTTAQAYDRVISGQGLPIPSGPTQDGGAYLPDTRNPWLDPLP